MKTTSRLHELTRSWAAAKSAENEAHREAEKLREAILAAGGQIGYEDEFLAIGKTTKLEGSSQFACIKNERLERALREEAQIEEVQVTAISLEKVRALGKLNKRVERALEAISVESPRFEQVAKKA